MIELSLCLKVVELLGEKVCVLGSSCVMGIHRGTFFVVLENGEENDQWYRLNRVEVYKLCIDVLGFNWNADWF